MKLDYFQITDKGRVRENNEDSLAIVEDGSKGLLLVLADGLGGLARGEVASRLAVEEVETAFRALNEPPSGDWLERAFQKANQKIHSENQRSGEEMATTLTACHFWEDRLCIVHVGDCRVYRIRGGPMQCLTTDHAVDRTTLTRAIGIRRTLTADTRREPVEAGDLYLVCSDGLYSMLPEKKLSEMIREVSPEQSCRGLVRQANAAGGLDNISVQVVKIPD